MKAKLDAIIQQDQAEYLDELLTQKDPLLAEMEAYAAEHRVPIADREVSRFIEITARITGARKALEIGMAIGYSVVHLARGMGGDLSVESVVGQGTTFSLHLQAASAEALAAVQEPVIPVRSSSSPTSSR